MSKANSLDSRPPWDADRQRSHLRGFTRLRAILWKRSLEFYQTFVLGGTSWYRPLVRALRKGPDPLSLLSPERVKAPQDIFGETPVLTAVRLLELAELYAGPLPTPVIDLGCGRGVICLTAASLGHSALGFEQERDWALVAQGIADSLSLPARFVAGDLLQAEWPTEGTFFVIATAFPDPFRDEVLQKLNGLSSRSVLITVDWDLSEEGYQRLWAGRLPVDWGVTEFVLWSTKSQTESL